MKIFQKIFERLDSGRTAKSAALVEILELYPFEGPVYVLGDLHGCMAAYCQVEAIILKDAQKYDNAATIILLGDIVDRGPQTAGLIDHLIKRKRAGQRLVCLRGNHEEMMLDFWANPEDNMDWLDFGGLETLASYGIDTANLSRMPARKLRQILAAYLPQNHVDFLKETLHGLKVGRFLLTHAGADSEKTLTEQPVNALLWGSSGQVAPHDLILVHGHYVVAEPMISARCLSIDTGAYLNGRLSCLRLLPNAQPALLTLTQADVFQSLDGVVF